MREIVNKVIPGLLLTTIIGLFSSFMQIHDNKTAILNLAEEKQKMEEKHLRRIEKLEVSRENMGNFFVTRAEFNVIVQAQNEKINKIDRNIEKLLDLQMKK